MTSRLPSGYTPRPATLADLDAVARLIELHEIAEFGAPEWTRDDIAKDWQFPGFSLETDSLVVSAADGTLAAYASVFDTQHIHIYGEMCLHPAHDPETLRAYVVQWIERRAREIEPLAEPGVRVSLIILSVNSENAAAGQTLRDQGFARIRTFWRMRIDMTTPPPAPEWPEGITVRTRARETDDYATYEVDEEAFSDHFGHLPTPFEEWQRLVALDGDDPTLWFLAGENDQVGGIALCSVRGETGWVDTLAVRRAFRRRGLGLALLRHAFGEFYRRSIRSVVLGVDASNLTGATRLYERAGMHVSRRFDRYEKELRAGHERGTLSLASATQSA